MKLESARKAIESGIERGLHVGAQLYVSLDCNPVADLAFGMARDGVAMTPDTIMLWMSATKPITVIALAQVWERGKIALDDPVAKYIPAFGARGKGVITIRHVLTHTGGFRAAVGAWTADPWNNIIAQICDEKIEPGWIVGQTSGYHIAPSWYLLAEIVRRVSADGRPNSQYVREEVLEPLRCATRGSGCRPHDGASTAIESRRCISAAPSSRPGYIRTRRGRTAPKRSRLSVPGATGAVPFMTSDAFMRRCSLVAKGSSRRRLSRRSPRATLSGGPTRRWATSSIAASVS